MKVYISGPMRGYPDHNFPAFQAAEESIRKAGHTPCSPHRAPQHDTPTDYLKFDIRWLLDCDAVTLLDGWRNSVGARCEVAIALSLSMKFVDHHGDDLPRPCSVNVTEGYSHSPLEATA